MADIKTKITNEIKVEFDANRLTQNSLSVLYQLPNIIQETNDLGKFNVDIFTITINSLSEYQKELINIDSKWYRNKLL